MITLQNFKEIEKQLDTIKDSLAKELVKIYFKHLVELCEMPDFKLYYSSETIVKEEVNEALSYFNELLNAGLIKLPENPKQKEQQSAFQTNFPYSKLADKSKNWKPEPEKKDKNESYISPQSRANLLQGKFLNKSTTPKIKDLRQKVYFKLDPRKHYIIDEAFKCIGSELNEDAIKNYGANVFARELVQKYNSPEHFKMSTIKEVLRIAQSYF